MSFDMERLGGGDNRTYKLLYRFDTNPLSLQTIRTATGLQPVTVPLLSLPLYAVESRPRLIDQFRVERHTSEPRRLDIMS